MKTKMKGKGKARVGIVLAAIMLASIFVAMMPTVSAYDPRFDPPRLPEFQSPPENIIGTIDLSNMNHLEPLTSISTSNPLKSTTSTFKYSSQPITTSTFKPFQSTTSAYNPFQSTISTYNPFQSTTSTFKFSTSNPSWTTLKPGWWSKPGPLTLTDINTLQKHYDTIYNQPVSYKPISSYNSYSSYSSYRMPSYSTPTSFNSYPGL